MPGPEPPFVLPRGPALPALPDAPGVPALGVPGPREEWRARPLDAAGTLPRPRLARGPLLGPTLPPGPAEDSRWFRLRSMLAAGLAGAELECCPCNEVVRTWRLPLGPDGVALLVMGLSGEFATDCTLKGTLLLLAALGRNKEGISSGSVKPGSPRS